MALKYFLDTFAFFEIIHGNPKYKRYLTEPCCTSILNLYELYYHLLKEEGKDFADNEFRRFLLLKIDIPNEIFPKAAAFRAQCNSQGISFIDALGYALARENNLLFVTGDKEFKNVPHVEWVR